MHGRARERKSNICMPTRGVYVKALELSRDAGAAVESVCLARGFSLCVVVGQKKVNRSRDLGVLQWCRRPCPGLGVGSMVMVNVNPSLWLM